MTQQQAQQQTQENSPLDLKETDSENKKDTNKKNTKEEKVKEVSLLNNTFYDEEPKEESNNYPDRKVYNSEFLNRCCKWLLKKVCKKENAPTRLVPILCTYFGISFLNNFVILFSSQLGSILSVIKVVIILVITTLSMYATSKAKRSKIIFYIYCIFVIFMPIVLTIVVPLILSKVPEQYLNDINYFLYYLNIVETMLTLMGLIASGNAINEDYNKLKENEV